MKIRLRNRNREIGMVLLWIILGILVLVVGGIVVYQFVRFCQRHFPTTPPPNRSTNDTSGATAPYGAYFFQKVEPSYVPNSGIMTNCTVPFELQYVVTETTNGPCMRFTSQGFPGLVTSNEFRADLLSDYGIDLQDPAQNYYATNGVATDAAGVPITFTNGVVRVGEGGYTVVLWRSFDLSKWTQVFTNIAPTGITVQFTDDVPCTTSVFYLGEIR